MKRLISAKNLKLSKKLFSLASFLLNNNTSNCFTDPPVFSPPPYQRLLTNNSCRFLYFYGRKICLEMSGEEYVSD